MYVCLFDIANDRRLVISLQRVCQCVICRCKLEWRTYEIAEAENSRCMKLHHGYFSIVIIHRKKAISVMVEFKEVEGYDSLKSTLASLEKSDKPVFVLFTGSKDSSGKSWCPDCVTAHPVVHESVKESLTDGIFITCHVGLRDYWKNLLNPFRTDPKLKIGAVPTLIRWGKSDRLVEEQLFTREMVDMLFED